MLPGDSLWFRGREMSAIEFESHQADFRYGKVQGADGGSDLRVVESLHGMSDMKISFPGRKKQARCGLEVRKCLACIPELSRTIQGQKENPSLSRGALGGEG